MRTRKEPCSLTNMLSLLPTPKHYFTSLGTVEKGTCKQRIGATFLGTRTIFIRAVPKIFCCVNQAKVLYFNEVLWKKRTYFNLQLNFKSIQTLMVCFGYLWCNCTLSQNFDMYMYLRMNKKVVKLVSREK